MASQLKRFKMGSNEFIEILPIVSKPLNLVTVNNDCKELIFEYLELTDLVNIAQTSKQLNAAVSAVFKRKYGNKKIRFGYLSHHIKGSFPVVFPDVYMGCIDEIKDRDKSLLIDTPMMSFKVLRNFGHTMTEIAITTFSEPYKPAIFYQKELYLAEYCPKSLKKLLVVGNSLEKTLFENIQKPFQNVTSIEVKFCYLGPKLFSEFFPNLESLHLSDIVFKSFSVIKEHFPKLKELHFFNPSFSLECPWGYRAEFQGDEVIEMIKLNPQLETLKLYILKVFDGARLIHFIREYLPVLKSLLFFYEPSSLAHDLPPFHFNSVVDFNLIHRVWNEPQRTSDINLFTFSKLQRISLSFCMNFDENHRNSYQPILDFIQKNTDLTSINLYGPIDGNLNILFKSLLPNIEELSILYFKNEPPFNGGEYFYPFMCDVLCLLTCRPSLKKLLIKKLGSNLLSNKYPKAFCDAIASHSTEYKIITDLKERYICKKCQNYYEKCCISVEFTLKKTDTTSMRYTCTIRDEENWNAPAFNRSTDFIVIECLKIDK